MVSSKNPILSVVEVTWTTVEGGREACVKWAKAKREEGLRLNELFALSKKELNLTDASQRTADTGLLLSRVRYNIKLVTGNHNLYSSILLERIETLIFVM